MKNFAQIFIGCSLIVLLAMPALQAQGQKVTSLKKRQKTLDTARELLDLQNEELLGTFSELIYPFDFEEEEIIEPVVQAPVEVKTDEPKPVVVKPVVVKVTDKQILERVAGTINPTGSLTRNEKSVLILSKGQIQEGGTIRVNVQGEARIIVFEEITPDYFVLRLNEETFRKEFSDSVSPERIRKDVIQKNVETKSTEPGE